MKKLFKKLNSKQGFTLVEMLASIIVLVLVTGIISLTVNMSVKYYTQSMRESAAQELCASLSTAVQEEMQYATSIQKQGTSGGYSYYSRARQHGSGCTITAVNGQLVVCKNGKDNYGLVGSKAYAYGIVATVNSTWNEADQQFDCTINVLESDAADARVLATKTFSVHPLNKGH